MAHRVEQIGPCTLILGDCAQVLSTLEPESIDCVVTSPPYDNLRVYGGHSWDFQATASGLTRAIKVGGVIVWVVADATVDGSETLTSMRQAIYFKDKCGLNMHDTMIYMKDAPQFPDANRYGQVWEYCFVLSSGTPKAKNLIADRKNLSFGRKVTGTNRNADGSTRRAAGYGNEIKPYGARFNVWQIPSTKGNGQAGHPAQFPLNLARDHIRSWSNEGDTVLDCFTGSGTTAVACIKTGRRFIGCEVNEEYFEIACNRIRKAWQEKRSELPLEAAQ